MSEVTTPGGLIVPSAHWMKRPGAQAPGMDASRRASSATDQALSGWRPQLTPPNWFDQWEREPAVARTRDLINNDALAQAGAERLVSMVVGGRLRFAASHITMARRLGIEAEAAKVMAKQIEAAWEMWAYDQLNRADWGREQNFGGLVNLNYRHYRNDGDGLAVLRWDEDGDGTSWPFRTSLQTIDPDRLSNPTGRMNSRTLNNGIENDGRAATLYHIREAHPYDFNAYGQQLRWEPVPVRQAWGRPVIVHLRKKTRAGEYRGVSPMVAVLRRFKLLQRYTDAELQNAALNASYVATIKTTRSAGEVAEALDVAAMTEMNDVREAYYGGADPRMSDGSKIARLWPEDDLEFQTAQRQAADFAGFHTAFTQAIASGLGLSYEQLSMDFSKTNYSSYRGALVEIWRGVVDERNLVADQFCFPVALAVVEEAIDLGLVEQPAGCPDLYECPAGWLAGRWIGPGRGWVDPVKEAMAAQTRVSAGLSSLEQEVAEQSGGDWDEVAAQIAIEREEYQKLGLTPPSIAEMVAGAEAVQAAGGDDGRGE